MYGGYGSYGGLGGYGSYGGGQSNGYGGYSNGYGGLSSYRGYGERNNQSSNRMKSENQSQTKNQGESQIKQNETPNNNQLGKQTQQPQNGTKQVFEQWFKMMGGLRSILELGFAALALTQFVTTSSQLLKRIFQFSKQKGVGAAKYMEQKLETNILKKLASTQTRGKYLKRILLLLFRISTFALIILGIRLKREIQSQAKKKQAQLREELQKIRDKEIELLSQSQIPHQTAQESQSCEKTAIL